jgi:hypothetical protein
VEETMTKENEPQSDNYMDAIKTITGYTLTEAIAKLQEVLPPPAYKSVPGGAKLTDINPAHLTEVATKVFGMCGVGWWFDWEPNEMELETLHKVNAQGKAYDTYSAKIFKFSLFLRLFRENGEEFKVQPIPSNGGSINMEPGWALRGAMTSCIGASFSKLCWQLGVYKGEITHLTHGPGGTAVGGAGKQPAKQKTESSPPPDMPRVENQWEQDVVDAIVEVGLIDDKARPHAINILNRSALMEVPYKQLQPVIGVAFVIAWQSAKEKYPDDSTDERAEKVNMAWADDTRRNDWLDEATDLISVPPEMAESAGPYP